VIGAHQGRVGANVYTNFDLQKKCRFDFQVQQYSNNSIDVTGNLNWAQGRYGHESLPGDIIQPCGNHSGTMCCPMPLFERFRKEGRLDSLFDGIAWQKIHTGGDTDWQKLGTRLVKDTWSLQPVDYTLDETWSEMAAYLRKVGTLYGDRTDINNVRISWEPTNSWGTQVDETRETPINFHAEKGHHASGHIQFRRRMKEKFGSIGALNEARRTSYGSFDELDPSAFRRVHPTNRTGTSPLFYEWELHRRRFFAEWLEHCRRSLREGGCRQPITSELPVPQHDELRHALDPYFLATTGDFLCAHDHSMGDSREIVLESLQHYFPGKGIGSLEYYWNQPEAQFSQTETISAAACSRNLWRLAAHGTSLFAAYIWHDWGPYPGWLSTSNVNFTDYYVDYSLLRVSAGALQLQHAKLDALAHAFLETRQAARKVAVYWPTAATINAMPLDVITLNREDEYRGIIPTLHWMLFRRGIPYRYVFEHAMLEGKEDLAQLRVLVLPYAAWLPKSVSALLAAWVRDGGTLISAGPFGAETPYGFQDAAAMKEIFGEGFAVEHVGGTEWSIVAPEELAGSDVVEMSFGKGRVVMTSGGFELFHGEGNHRFWQVLDANVMRDAWCTVTDGGRISVPSIDLAMREDGKEIRYLFVTNLDARSPVQFTLGLKGRYDTIMDLGVPGSVAVKPKLVGENSYLALTLEQGDATVLKLSGHTGSDGDADTSAMRTKVRRLTRLAKEDSSDVAALTRRQLASRYNRLLGRGPVGHFEPVRPGKIIVKAPFADGLRLEVADAEIPSLENPERVFGRARVEDGALVLDAPGSAVSYTGEGFQQS
jgi:hypothetical protein